MTTKQLDRHWGMMSPPVVTGEPAGCWLVGWCAGRPAQWFAQWFASLGVGAYQTASGGWLSGLLWGEAGRLPCGSAAGASVNTSFLKS